VTADRPKSIELPKAAVPPAAVRGQPRRSTIGKWRALVLSLIYVGFIAHFAHWWVAGRTLSPVEPSESMYTLEQGLLNAGFICFLVGIVSTLILGRWFCGWGCHIIALQDLCTWLLKRLHFRPKPFRSRLLMFVPLAAALYMFVWPTALRLYEARPAPALVYHLFTHDFWQTFPGPLMSIITLIVAGFLIVVLLGNKGYCYYACPYGGFFGLADKLAVGRIRVTEACEQCGHCTATCTSNVRVHEEVKRYGMVVDPGCMKCTDCISVCPKDALYFGFGRPSLFKGAPRAAGRQRDYDYTWPEELALAGFLIVSLYAFRGLYDAIPLLLALGLAPIAAYLLVQAGRLLYEPNVRIHTLALKFKGRMTASGWAFGLFSLLLSAWIAHSAVLQYHVLEGERLLAIAGERQAASTSGVDEATITASRDALAHLLWVRSFALVPLASVETQIGSLYAYLNELDRAEPHLRKALALAPSYAAARYKWAELIARRGDLAAGVAELRRAVEDNPALIEARHDLTRALLAQNQRTDAIAILERVIARRPHDAMARVELASLLIEGGGPSPAAELLREAVRLQPGWAEAHLRLGLAEAKRGDREAANAAVRVAARLTPGEPRALLALGGAYIELGQQDSAEVCLNRARNMAPLDREVLITWASGLQAMGRLDAVIGDLASAGVDDVPARYALVYLFLARGDTRAAAVEYARVRKLDPSLPPPPGW
jgi:tetratricopeptide (TPR) repeat protein/ferredoxin